MKAKAADFKNVICPICGKSFIPAAEHVYKRVIKNARRYICSYHCTLEYDKNKIDRRHARSAQSLRSVKADASEGKGACGTVCEMERDKG